MSYHLTDHQTTVGLVLMFVGLVVLAIPLLETTPVNFMDIAPKPLHVPCPTCNGNGFVSFEDRHTETWTDNCTTCGGRGEVLANTGQTPEYSAPPVAPRASNLSVVRFLDQDSDVEIRFSHKLSHEELRHLRVILDLFCGVLGDRR